VPAPRKHDKENRARAVRMYQERIRDLGESKLTARRQVGSVLDIEPPRLQWRLWFCREVLVRWPAGAGVHSLGSCQLK